MRKRIFNAFLHSPRTAAAASTLETFSHLSLDEFLIDSMSHCHFYQVFRKIFELIEKNLESTKKSFYVQLFNCRPRRHQQQNMLNIRKHKSPFGAKISISRSDVANLNWRLINWFDNFGSWKKTFFGNLNEIRWSAKLKTFISDLVRNFNMRELGFCAYFWPRAGWTYTQTLTKCQKPDFDPSAL